MAVRRIIPDLAYGIGDALIPLAPLPIIARRDPGVADLAQLGTTWVNEATGAVWILAQVATNSANWVTSPVIGGVGVFTSLEVTTGDLTIDAGAGGIDVGAGNFTVDNSGNVDIQGDLDVAGTFTFTGDLNLTSASAIDITSTFNGPSIILTANGGANEQIYLHSEQGTTASSIKLTSDLGGVLVQGALNSSSAVVIDATNAAGGVQVLAGTNGILLGASNGPISILSGTGAIGIGNDAAAHAITIGNGTGATSLTLASGTGAINVGTNAVAHAITIGNVTGATAVDINAGSGGIGIAALNSAVQITSGTGQMDIGSDAAATTINVGVAAAVKTVTVGSTNTTSTTQIQSGTGGLGLLATNGTLAISSGTGVMNISADGSATTVNISTANAAKTLTIGSVNAGSSTTLRSGAAGMTILSGTGAMAISSDAAATVVGIANGAAVKTVTLGSTNTTSTTTIQGGTGGVVVSAPFLALPGPVYVYTGAGAPGNGLALHIGDIYINTTAASAVTRMYIATGVGAWTNITCAA